MDPDHAFDESWLSAYLDDELPPADRRRVERALQADPTLAALLMDLRRSREWIAGLSRPESPDDPTAAIFAKLAARSQLRRRLVGSVAATVLAAGGLTFWAASGPRDDGGPMVAVVPVEPAIPAPIDPPAPIEPAVPAVAMAPAPSPRVEPVRVADDDPEERRRVEGRRFVMDVLDRDVRRVVVSLDPSDATGADEVDTILRKTGRRHPTYGRLRVGQGVVIDPARPGEAVVFAFVADEPELKLIVDRLDRHFGDRALVRRDRPKPEVTALLADAGTLDLLPGQAAGVLGPPPLVPPGIAGHLALRVEDPEPRAEVPGPLPRRNDLPPRELPVAPGDSAVLVWVTWRPPPVGERILR